jgi:hypothetical protein
LLKVAQRTNPPEVAIVLQVETVRIEGADAPFHVAGRFVPKLGWLWDILSSMNVGVTSSHTESGVSGLKRTYDPPDGEYNALTFPGTRKILEPGFKTEWQTVVQ